MPRLQQGYFLAAMEPATRADEPLELRLSRLAAGLQAATAAGDLDAGDAQHPAPPKLEASVAMPAAPAAVPAQSAPPAAGDALDGVAAAAMPLAARGRGKAAAGRGDESDSDSCIVLSSSPPSEDDEAAGPARVAAPRTAFRRSYALRRRSAAPPAAPPAAVPPAEPAGAAAGGASVPDGKPVLDASRSAAQPLLGVRVMVPFVDFDGETRLFPGVVTRRVAGRGAGASYLVMFDDGDESVVAADELLALMSGKDTGAAQGGAAGPHTAGASPSTRRGGSSAVPSPPSQTTRYHGVYYVCDKWTQANKHFRAALFWKGKQYWAGRHTTTRDAALAADQMARKHGVLHKLNFPETADEHIAVARGCAAAEESASRGRKQKSDAAAAAVPQPPAKRGRASGPPPESKSGAVLVKLPPSRPAGANRRRELAPMDAAAAPSREEPAPTPAAAPPQQAFAPAPATAGAAGDDAAAAFLRGINPPLTCLDAALAELPRSGITAALLRHVALSNASASPAERETRVNMLAGGLKIALPGDKLMLGIALDELARSA